jgi:hypothetical protein
VPNVQFVVPNPQGGFSVVPNPAGGGSLSMLALVGGVPGGASLAKVPLRLNIAAAAAHAGGSSKARVLPLDLVGRGVSSSSVKASGGAASGGAASGGAASGALPALNPQGLGGKRGGWSQQQEQLATSLFKNIEPLPQRGGDRAVATRPFKPAPAQAFFGGGVRYSPR